MGALKLAEHYRSAATTSTTQSSATRRFPSSRFKHADNHVDDAHEISKVARIQQLIHATGVHGLTAATNPGLVKMRSHAGEPA